jgi:SAM-dependent methyltransferase
MNTKPSWNPVWDQIYRKQAWGKYPPEALIRFIARHYYQAPQRSDIRILDLGCGFGAATCYLCREGFQVTSIDGSDAAVGLLKKRLKDEQLTARVLCHDLSHLPFDDDTFHCAVDLQCLMCNGRQNTARIVMEIWRVIKPFGRLFSYTPRTGCWGDGIGTHIEKHTFADAQEGPFANMGVVRFTAEQEFQTLYQPFELESLEYAEHSVLERRHAISFWVAGCLKK